jgi:hypothetical protein
MLLKFILSFLIIILFNYSAQAQISPKNRAVLRADALSMNLDLTSAQQDEIKNIFLSFERQYDKQLSLYAGNPEGLEKAISLNERSMHTNVLKALNTPQKKMYIILVSNNYEISPKRIDNFSRVRQYSAEE